MKRLRFWWASRRNPMCDGGSVWSGRCNRPSVGCVRYFTKETHVCEWHLEPMEIKGESYGLAFLARWLVLP